MQRFARLMLFVCLLLAMAACSQDVSRQPAASSSPVIHTTTPLEMLQQRPLHLQGVAVDAPCPTSPEKQVQANFGIAQGDGPAYATIGTETITSPAIFHYADAQHFQSFGNGIANTQGWGGQKVLWFVNPHYQGLVLVRGHQLDGPHEMRFNGGPDGQPLSQQLVLNTTDSATDWANFPSYTRLLAPGCYAYQVDGTSFSSVIVFQAVVQN